MILYMENPKTLPRNRTNESSKVTGYKTNIWKSVPFLNTNKELSEKDIRKLHLQECQNKKILTNKFKEVKYLYT